MSGPKHTPAWERVVTLDDHDALKRELAEERDRVKRLAEALKRLLTNEPMPYIGHQPGAFVILVTQDDIDGARVALREAGVTDA